MGEDKAYMETQKTVLQLRKIALGVADAVIILVAAILSHIMVGAEILHLPFFIWVAANVLFTILVFALLGLYDIVFSSVGIAESMKTAIGTGVLFVLNLIALFLGELLGLTLPALVIHVLLV